MKLYKVLDKDMNSCDGGTHHWAIGEWYSVPEVQACRSGFHLTTNPWGGWYRPGRRVFVAEGDVAEISRDDKVACYSARITKEVTHEKPLYWVKAETFIASLKNIPYNKPDGEPNKEWKLFLAPTLAAARDAALDAALDAARCAVRDAALDAALDASWDAARSAVRDAAWADARSVARSAVRDAALDVVRDAALDAALYASAIISERKFDKKDVDYINRRWEVTQKGYFCLCDVDGVLYVYGVQR